MNRTLKKLLIGLGALLVVGIGAVVVYNVFIKDEPERLGFTDTTDATTVPGGPTTTGGPAATTAPGAAPPAAGIDGTWTVGAGTEVGYRVKEDFVGGLADQTAVGRTTAVTGQVTIAGPQATVATFTADLTRLKSDSTRRDAQVQGRILETARFPEATFTLTAPIAITSVPDIGVETRARATGDLTVHGVTRSVTFELTAKRTSATELQIIGAVPLQWSDYGISSPSLAGFVGVRDAGEMEFRLVLGR